MNKKTLIWIILVILLIIIISVTAVFVIKESSKSETDVNAGEKNQPILNDKEGLDIIPTMSDVIKSKDTAWCSTFQLVWNDMKNDVVKKDVIFTPQEEMAVNLNKGEFTEDMISDEYYYKKYGLKTPTLKDEIEKGIKEKFDQESDILNDFDWSESESNEPNNPNMNRYFFYTMLFRKFDFLKEFKVLEKGNFGNDKTNVSYFGIDSTTDKSVGNQINVLYYNSKDDFALLINTKSNDEVIFCKNPQGLTFNEIYTNMNKKSNEYNGDIKFSKEDIFKAPNIKFNEKREYKEFQEKIFKNTNGTDCLITKAIQSIKLSLDEKGGEIKSEAAIDVSDSVMPNTEKAKKPRYFYLDNTFAMFLKEKGKDTPYFASRIEDITKFQ